MIVGCYSLHLYCDNEDAEHPYREFPHTFTGELGRKCRQEARRAGWTIRGTKAYCPLCNGKPKK
jgi:hypothetical protein